MKHKILFISHCFFNDATKLKHQNETAQTQERLSKRRFLKQALNADIELIQLPCPEFILYGSNRWGHAASQFNTPFFREASRQLLEPFVLQIKEYLASPERFEVLGVLGIDGSPSCGINYTYDGDWGGELSTNPNLDLTLKSISPKNSKGIFMEVFQQLLQEEHLNIPFYSLETFLSLSYL